jgi:hypothetical protein
MEHAQGRMRIKVLGAMEAIEMGVGKVVFADGRVLDVCRDAGASARQLDRLDPRYGQAYLRFLAHA